jgi:hypothetical protein
LTTLGKPWRRITSGAGARDISATALAVISTPSFSNLRVSGSKERKDRPNSAVSGMMFDTVPDRK